jgi:2-iminobutanoate/2-iminopropanoate deaminase
MKEIIKTDNAPVALGPYSQAVKVSAGTMVFCSAQISLDSASGKLIGNAAAEQFEQCLKNLQAVLHASGAELKHVVRTTLFLTDMGYFVPVNEVYARYFTIDLPARVAIEVTRLPKDAKVAIDAIAII